MEHTYYLFVHLTVRLLVLFLANRDVVVDPLVVVVDCHAEGSLCHLLPNYELVQVLIYLLGRRWGLAKRTLFDVASRRVCIRVGVARTPNSHLLAGSLAL